MMTQLRVFHYFEQGFSRCLPQEGFVDLQGYIVLSLRISIGDISLLIPMLAPVVLSIIIGFWKIPFKVLS